MRECLEEGTIQAYVDGELSPPEADRVAAHAGACATCAAAVGEAENELAILSTAFAPELSLSVPSERLRERLDASLNELRLQMVAPEKARTWNLKGWLGSLASSFNFAPRHAVGFASLFAVLAFAAIFALVASRQNGRQSSLAAVAGKQEMNLTARVQTAQRATPANDGGTIVDVAHTVREVGKPRRAVVPARALRTTTNASASAVAAAKPLPGELNYLKTIASLSSIIEANGESSLRPSLRGEYERNLALVNNAIDATRRTARRQPKNQDAVEFLYSSYQSKIDLLSTVAEQGQMVAALR
jgi:anti-sigma factor RsiW